VPVWGNRWERERRSTGTSYFIVLILSSFNGPLQLSKRQPAGL
jgi:hypothetical protein